jgi:hypothetical protein
VITFASPLLSARQIERRCAVLPCADCSAKGPHRISLVEDGGREARCERCRQVREAQVQEQIAQQLAGVVHGSASVEGS